MNMVKTGNIDLDELDALREAVQDSFRSTMEKLIDILPKVKDMSYPLSDLADIGWECREIEKFSDELRKEAAARKELVGRLLAYRKITECMIEGGSTTVYGQIAYAMPDVKQQSIPPKHGTEEYEKLCTYFGITQEMADSKCIAFHYKHLEEYTTALAEEGKNPPAGILAVNPVYYARFQIKKEK